jgi:hypothetical protein
MSLSQKKLVGHSAHFVLDVALHCWVAYDPGWHLEHMEHVLGSVGRDETRTSQHANAIIFFIFLYSKNF